MRKHFSPIRPRGAVQLGSLLAATALSLLAVAEAQSPEVAAACGPTDTLCAGFRDPPPAARPRAWWHWMNGNVTHEGIDHDLEWMARIGIGGVQAFDASMSTPTIVDRRLIHMQPDWKDAFRHAIDTAARLGLDVAIAASPGWSETGGRGFRAKMDWWRSCGLVVPLRRSDVGG